MDPTFEKLDDCTGWKDVDYASVVSFVWTADIGYAQQTNKLSRFTNFCVDTAQTIDRTDTTIIYCYISYELLKLLKKIYISPDTTFPYVIGNWFSRFQPKEIVRFDPEAANATNELQIGSYTVVKNLFLFRNRCVFNFGVDAIKYLDDRF